MATLYRELLRNDPFVERVTGIEQQRERAGAVEVNQHFGDVADFELVGHRRGRDRRRGSG